MNPDPLFELESEKSYIGSILLKGTSSSLDQHIESGDFYSDLHKRIYKSILNLNDQNAEVDPISVINEMRDKALFKDEARESEQILALYRDVIVAQPTSYYSKRIKKLSDRRKYIDVLRKSIESLHAESHENEIVFTKIETELSRISRSVQIRGLRSVKESKNELVDYLQKIFEFKGVPSGLKTHFTELDEITTGLKTHELLILAARPGWGKTTLALNIASNVALKENKGVAIFSLEMSTLELLIKMVCADARINSTLLKTGAIQKKDQEKLLGSLVKITSAPIFIDDSGALTIWEFKGRLRQLVSSQPISLIVVDYLQLLSDPENKESRQIEVSSISRHLKQMAREANCPVIAISQMSRSVETRSKDQKPQLSDLRESGAIEQDADIVAFIYREDRVKTPEELKPEMKNIAEVIIAKNRSGMLGSFHLLFSPEYSRFDNVASGSVG